MTIDSICIVDDALPLNEDFYKELVKRTAEQGVSISFVKKISEVPTESSALLLASPMDLRDVDSDRIVLGLRTINRKERLQIAEQVVPDSLIANWASPANEQELSKILQSWGKSSYIFKYDWSAGRRGVMLLEHEKDKLPEDYAPEKDVVMEYLDDDSYTYKADLCCGVLLNSWFLRTQAITDGNFNEYTRNPSQYALPDDTKQHLQQLSVELMRYGSGYISVDMMRFNGEFKIIEINSNSVGRNIAWNRFGDTYLETYPAGLKNLLKSLPDQPRLSDLRRLRGQPNKILPLIPVKE